MSDLNKNYINQNFIVISDNRQNHLLSTYVGIDDRYSEKTDLTHKFSYSYTTNFRIYHGYYPLSSQKYYVLKSIDLPFDVLCIINQFIYSIYI